MPASFRVTNSQYYCDDPFTRDDFIFSCQTYTELIMLLLLLLYCLIRKWGTQYPTNIFGLRRVQIIMYALVETFGCSTSCARVCILYIVIYSIVGFYILTTIKLNHAEGLRRKWRTNEIKKTSLYIMLK